MIKRELNIDLETYSSADLPKCGTYKYCEAPDFAILLLAYSFDDEPVKLVDIASGELVPQEVIDALDDPTILKTAWNAQFERTCLAAFYAMNVPPEQWECTMVKAMNLGLPAGLGNCAGVLKLPQQKDLNGFPLIRYFSMPCAATKTNGGRTRNLPAHAPEKWDAFKKYCIRDVDTERAIRRRISFFKLSEAEHRLWCLDQRINDNGVLLDKKFIKNAVDLDMKVRAVLTDEAAALTGLDNPNSVAQLIRWFNAAIAEYESNLNINDPEAFAEAEATRIETLKKGDLPALAKKYDDAKIQRMLEIRQEMAKTSVKKYVAMANAVCHDGRVRGLLQFYGASRTGRWAGRLVQIQNLPQNHIKDLDLARQCVRDGDLDSLEVAFGNVPDTLSQLIRTSFVAGKGNTFIVADFSAIEARIIAWLAGEQWRLDVFNTHGKIYEASAAKMFNVPIESVTKGSDLRQKGKVSELALGYQGGPNALVTMGALKMGVCDEAVTDKRAEFDALIGFATPFEIQLTYDQLMRKYERIKVKETCPPYTENALWELMKHDAEITELQRLVTMWRNANPKIVEFWKLINDMAIAAVEGKPSSIPRLGIKFYCQKGLLFIQLPSGRVLSYFHPKLKQGKFGSSALTYEGPDQKTKQWRVLDTYGGKLVENIVQAIARDCLADTMLRVEQAGYDIQLHVHDEIVVKVKDEDAEHSLEEILELMRCKIPWAKGLNLNADGYHTYYYKKD